MVYFNLWHVAIQACLEGFTSQQLKIVDGCATLIVYKMDHKITHNNTLNPNPKCLDRPLVMGCSIDLQAGLGPM